MITPEQLNSILGRPEWLLPYRAAGRTKNAISIMSIDDRYGDVAGVLIVFTVNDGATTVTVDTYGRTLDEKLELLHHVKTVASLFENPKVVFCVRR